MPFKSDDVYVGMIAWFTVGDLRRHPGIRAGGRPSFDAKPRPFVCYAEGERDEWYWTYLTGTWNPRRRTISRRWLRMPRGCTAFMAMPGDLIVGDGSDGFVGPAGAFAACSRRHDTFDGMYRPVLLPEGVGELETIVRGRGGPIPRVRTPSHGAARAA